MRRAAGEREFGFARGVDRRGRRRLQIELDGRQVHPGTDHEHPVRGDIEVLQPGEHVAQLGDGVGGVQLRALHLDDRTVGVVDHRDGGGVAPEEHQGGAPVIHRGARGHRQRARSMQLRDQHDVVDAVPAQGGAEVGGGIVVAPSHTDADQAVPAVHCGVAGGLDRGEGPARPG